MTSSFLPDVRNITSITQANPAVVTTSTNHGYSAGLYVRIVIPYPGSMPQIADQIFLITITGANTFSVPVDSTGFDAFTLAPILYGQREQQAQSIPIAEINSTFSNCVANIGPNNPRLF